MIETEIMLFEKHKTNKAGNSIAIPVYLERKKSDKKRMNKNPDIRYFGWG